MVKKQENFKNWSFVDVKHTFVQMFQLGFFRQFANNCFLHGMDCFKRIRYERSFLENLTHVEVQIKKCLLSCSCRQTSTKPNLPEKASVADIFLYEKHFRLSLQIFTLWTCKSTALNLRQTMQGMILTYSTLALAGLKAKKDKKWSKSVFKSNSSKLTVIIRFIQVFRVKFLLLSSIQKSLYKCLPGARFFVVSWCWKSYGSWLVAKIQHIWLQNTQFGLPFNIANHWILFTKECLKTKVLK